MELAAVDVVRVVEGVVGALLVLAVVVVLVVAALRWQREHRSARRADPGLPALARVGGPVVNPTVFGGGFPAGRSVGRRDTVTFGYLAVVEEFVSDDDSTHWCTLTVRLPGSVPELVVDHRSRLGRPDVPGRASVRAETGDAAFDAAYVAGAQDTATIAGVLCEPARQVLLASPVQRLGLRGSTVLVRTFDGTELDDAAIEFLAGLVGQFLAATPSFVTYARTPAAAGGTAADVALPPGLYGPQAAADLP